MAVVNNTLSDIGDVLFVEAQANIAGTVLALTSFSDTLIGETPSRYFFKQFRVSMNGVIFTSWQELTVPNLVGIGGLTGGIVYFQFAYTRVGTDPTGLLEFIEVDINGNIDAFVCSGVTTHLSIFNNYSCGNVYTAELCNNLVKKLYERGIVPEYIVRGDGVTDGDYVAFWSAIACYFSMFVSFASDFDNIINKRDWLIEYLREKGMFLCADDASLSDLQYLAGHFYDEIRKRGTIEIVRRKGFIRADGSTVPVDGELLRLVCWSVCEEFLFALAKPHRQGWCMGQSSPMYRHTLYEEQLIKGYENTKDVLDLSKYPLQNGGHVSLSPGQPLPPYVGGTGEVMVMTIAGAVPGNAVGIGLDDYRKAVKPITVSPYLDYEITAWIKIPGNPANTEMSFGVYAFDCAGAIYTLQNVLPGVNWDSYFNNSMKFPTSNWYFVRGIIYALDTQAMPYPNNLLNINTGNNLRFSNKNINRIVPRLTVKAGIAVSQAYVWDFKVRPLRTDYSTGFLNTANLLHIWAKNKNAKYSNEIEENIVRKFLVPYGTIPIHTWIGQKPAPDGTQNIGYWTIQNKFKIVN